jgi:hypothetical protein
MTILAEVTAKEMHGRVSKLDTANTKVSYVLSLFKRKNTNIILPQSTSRLGAPLAPRQRDKGHSAGRGRTSPILNGLLAFSQHY